MITKDMFIDLLGTMPGGTRSEHAEALRLAEDPSWGYDEVWRWAFNSGWYVFRRRGVAEECFGMLRAIGAPPEYALIYRSTTSSEDAVVCFKSGVPAAYAVGMRGWGINTRIRFFEAGVPIGYAPFHEQLTVAEVLTLTAASVPATYAASVIGGRGDAALILELWQSGVPLEYARTLLDELTDIG